jgi:8-oxo-dGTP pyrophosphatase MutT (NUDIX family)
LLTSEASLLQQIRSFLADYQPTRLSVDKTTPAAVLLLLYEKDGEPHILLTRRTNYVEHHKGETSFPGGAFDAEDGDLLTTALRETEEEIGVHPQDVEVLGRLDDIVTITDFLVSPFVAVLSAADYPFVVNAKEVAELVEVPLRHLMDERNLARAMQPFRDRVVPILTYSYGDHRIWGATARILKGFLDHLS